MSACVTTKSMRDVRNLVNMSSGMGGAVAHVHVKITILIVYWSKAVPVLRMWT